MAHQQILRFLHPAVIAMAATALLSCGHDTTTAPAQQLTVVISVDSTTWSYTTADGLPAVDCAFAMHAVASGAGAWKDATFHFYWGLDRSTAADSGTAPESIIAESWDGSAFTGGTPMTAHWRVTTTFPSEFDADYRFVDAQGAVHQATTNRVICGHTPPTSTPAPPTVQSFSLGQRPAGPLQIGQWLEPNMQDAAGGSGGVWMSYLGIRGAFSVDTFFADLNAASGSHTAHLEVPPDASVGAHVELVAATIDEFLQQGSASKTTNVVADTVRPRLSIDPCDRWATSCGPPFSLVLPGGTYFVGERLPLSFNAWDNRGLTYLHWHARPAATRDSLFLGRQEFSNFRFVPVVVRPEWVGSQSLRFDARDLTGLVSDTVASSAGSYHIYPTLVRPSTMRTLDLGQYGDVVVDAKRGRLYVREQGNLYNVYTLALPSLQLVSTLTLPDQATGMDLSPSGDSLVIALSESYTLAIVELSHPADGVVSQIAVPDSGIHLHPVRVRTTRTGKVLIVMYGATTGELQELDLATGTAKWLEPLSFGSFAAIQRSADHGRVAVWVDHCVKLFDAARDKLGACVPHEGIPSLSASGGLFLVGRDVYDSTGTQVSRLTTLDSSYVPQTAIAPDGQTAYEFVRRIGIVRTRVSDGALLDRTTINDEPATDAVLLASPDDSALFVLTSLTDDLHYVDLRPQSATPMAVRAPSQGAVAQARPVVTTVIVPDAALRRLLRARTSFRPYTVRR